MQKGHRILGDFIVQILPLKLRESVTSTSRPPDKLSLQVVNPPLKLLQLLWCSASYLAEPGGE